MKISLNQLTIAKARQGFLSGAFTARDLTEAYLKKIEEKNADINAYLEVFDDAESQAEEADKIIKKKGAESPQLCGIPLVIKDNILIKGRCVSAASKILEGYRATYDATAITKLKNHHPVFLGRANMDEFAMGASTENSAFGVTKNPHDETRVAGGSSGGSVAAVAADLALASLGSDTAGSVRQPSAFCGTVGLKPTYGSVSRYGLIAMGSSLDVIGPIGKTVEDCELLFSAMAGRDPLDSTSIEHSERVKKPMPPFTIGVPGNFVKEGVDADVVANFRETLARLERAGLAQVREINLPLLPYSLPAYYTIIPAEVSTNLARFDGVKYGAHVSGNNLLEDYLETRALFGHEAHRRILLGTYVLSAGHADAYYNKATAVRALVRKEVCAAFSGKDAVDVIMTPTTPTPAFPIGEKAQDPLSMYLADIFTVIANIAGIPALSVPSGVTVRDGKSLPLGVQLMGAHRREDMLFAVGSAIEQVRG
ncbi:MAG: Asp-tRNA(Asn)/Glu-tRNA(Gln) amidotransferase subunit GatA [Parcubacteria group bacterium]|nr:Asp-tRNA(Asn)/Glu-tRNA(Gln) amidotransferase subunit GatA [Parcubacteria group bacterium]